MRRTSRKVWRLTARTITVALVAACSTSPLTPPQNPVLTQPEANAVAEVVATDAASLVGGATLDAATGMPFAVAPMPGAPALATSSASCTPTRTPSPPTNSDGDPVPDRSEEHTSELQSRLHLVCRLLLEKKKFNKNCPYAA